MQTIFQNQGNSNINFNSVIYDLDSIPGSVKITGSCSLPSGNHELNATFNLDRLAIYVYPDGSLSQVFEPDQNAAHLCWYDGSDLNVIRHA